MTSSRPPRPTPIITRTAPHPTTHGESAAPVPHTPDNAVIDLALPNPSDALPPGTDVVDLAIPYALDALSPEEETALDAWLMATDDNTRRAFADLTRDVHETMALLAASSSADPPGELRARILAAVAVMPQDPPITSRLRRNKTRKLRWLLLAAATISTLALGGSPLAPPPNPGTIAAP